MTDIVLGLGAAVRGVRQDDYLQQMSWPDIEGVGWQTLHVLAVACPETSPQLAPDTYEQMTWAFSASARSIFHHWRSMKI